VLIHHTGIVKSIHSHDGLRGLYRGLGPTILGYLPTLAVYFSVYDFIKTTFGEVPLGVAPEPAGHAKGDQIYPAAQVKGYQPLIREHPWSLHLLSAMTAGAVSTCATNPLWVIKTRFMVSAVHSCRIQNLMHAVLDAIEGRSSLSPHLGCRTNNIPDRGGSSFLPGSGPELVGNIACSSAVSTL